MYVFPVKAEKMSLEACKTIPLFTLASFKKRIAYVRYLENFLLTSIFYHAPLWVQTPIRNTQNDLKIISVVYLFCT